MSIWMRILNGDTQGGNGIRRRWEGYLLALTLPLLTLTARTEIAVPADERPMLMLFMVPIVVSAAIGGLLAGLIATAFSLGLAHYYLIPPTGSFRPPQPYDAFHLSLLLVCGVLVSALAESQRRSRQGELAALRELADQRLQQQCESESRFRAIFEQAATGIAMVSPDGRWLKVNQKLCDIVGYTREELLALNFQDITYIADLPGDLECMRRMLAREIPSCTLEKRYVRKDASLVWINVTGNLLWKPDGEPDYYVAVIEDISHRKHAEAALHNAQRMARIGSWTWDLRSDRPVWSEEMFRILGRDPKLPPPNFSETQRYFAPKSWPRLSNAMDQAIGRGTPFELEAEVIRPDGGSGWAIVRGEPVRDAKGAVAALRGMVQDISERRRVENALRESEERMRLFIEHAPAALAMFDKQMRYLCASRRWMDDYHLSGGNILGMCHYDLFPDLPERWKQAHRRGLDGEVLRAEEDRIEWADGRVQWIRWELRPWLTAEGAIGGIVIFAEDLTELKQASEELRIGKAKLESALAAMSDAVWIADTQGHFVHFNEAFATIHRFRDKSECPKTLQEYPDILDVYLPNGELAPLEQWAVPRALRGERAQDQEYTLRRKDTGETWTGSYNLAPIRDETGMLIGSVVTGRDITERKRIEAEIRQLNLNLEQRVAERTRELTAANEELESFAYTVSHDLRAPLRAMSGFSKALIEDFGGELNDDAKAYLEQIDIAVRRMNDLIGGLLTLSRSTRGTLRHDVVDISAMATRLLAELARAEPEAAVDVSVEAGLTAQGDQRMIEAVLANLLDNAWKYSAQAAGRRIRVYAEQRDGRRWICVADNGAGFDMRYANQLFHPFRRLHRHDEFPGMGIGLATVQRILRRHGGMIDGRGEPGKGAIFSFTLPGAPVAGLPSDSVG